MYITKLILSIEGPVTTYHHTKYVYVTTSFARLQLFCELGMSSYKGELLVWDIPRYSLQSSMPFCKAVIDEGEIIVIIVY